MNRWLPLVVALGLAGLARWAIATRALPAAEADTLAASALFADALAHDGPTTGRLRAAFRPDPKQPRVAQLKGGRAWRAVGSSPPLPRWVGGLGVSVVGGETVLEGARWGAALAVALALALLVWAARSAGGAALSWAGLLTLAALPGTLQAATAAGYGAAGVLASAALLAAVRWLRVRPGLASGLAAGAALGLGWGVHPGAFALTLPVFVVLALAGRPTEDQPEEAPGSLGDEPGQDVGGPVAGTLALPWVPVTGLAIPVVALVVLVATWPALWSHTSKGLVAWATDTWRLAAPPQAVAGVVFDQLHGRAPQAWSALYQWTTWTPLPLLAAWVVGLGATVRAGRRGWWFPVLALATLLIVAGINGGLFGFRNDLLPMTLPFTAATAALGAAAVARWLGARLGGRRGAPRGAWSSAASWGLVAAVGLGPILYEQATTGYVPRGGPNGAEAALPAPLSVLRAIADADPKATVAVAGGGTSWRRSFEILWEDVGVSLNLRPLRSARWLVAVDDPAVPGVAEARAEVEGRPPELRSVAGGVPFVAYDRGLNPPRPARPRAHSPSKPPKKPSAKPHARPRAPRPPRRVLKARGRGSKGAARPSRLAPGKKDPRR